jgi:hypothetical protein
MRELRRTSRELGAAVAAMKAQAVLLPLPSAEETLFDFINEDEVKVSSPCDAVVLQKLRGGSVAVFVLRDVWCAQDVLATAEREMLRLKSLEGSDR